MTSFADGLSHLHSRRCEEHRDEAIQARKSDVLDCFATLAMTIGERTKIPFADAPSRQSLPGTALGMRSSSSAASRFGNLAAVEPVMSGLR
jgi:hypothetical protein